VFTGNVIMQSTDARVTAQRAEISFGAQRLRVIVLTGSPARFEQLAQREGLPTAGRAGRMEYDLTSGIVVMSGAAWLSDGNNEISGARISYDLRNERVTADADETGQVRLRITPPERGETAPAPQQDAPPAPPADIPQ
jgi:lipopolysaccharide export system protein LptA